MSRTAAGKSRPPTRLQAAKGLRISVHDSEQHLADDQRTDRAEALPVFTDLSLLHQVVPERSLAGPAVLPESDLVGAKRLLTDK